MGMFDIDFDQELFIEYIEKLHEHLVENSTFDELVEGMNDHHQKHHLVTLHLLKDKNTFYHYFNHKEQFQLTSVFDILIGALTESVTGDKIKEHFISYLNLSPVMITSQPSVYDKKVLMKNLKSFMAYSRKRKGVYDRPFDI